MVLYNSTIKDFCNDVDEGKISELLNQSMKTNLYRFSSDSEKNSWINSLEYMSNVLKRTISSQDCSVVIEYNCMNLKDFKWIVGGNIARNI